MPEHGKKYMAAAKNRDIASNYQPRQALEIVKNDANTIDLIITDVVMPNMDGPTMVKHIKELKPELRVIFMSGYAEEAFRRNDQNSEDIHFLPKPFGLKQLAAKVKEVLAGG